RSARQRPAAGVEDAAFLREGRANRVTVGGSKAGDVVVVLAHRDFARLQRLLELSLVAVPEANVRANLGEFLEDLKLAFLGVEGVGAAEQGLGSHFQQERVGDEREQAEL